MITSKIKYVKGQRTVGTYKNGLSFIIIIMINNNYCYYPYFLLVNVEGPRELSLIIYCFEHFR